MTTGILSAIEDLEKENANLQPELLTPERARELMAAYSRADKLVAFGLGALSRKLDHTEVARFTGSPIGKAKNMVATGTVMAHSQELSSALQQGDISLEQATEIAAAEESAPGAARELVAVAQEKPFHVLKDNARKLKLEAEQHRDLFARQRAARAARSHCDELGMVHIHLALQPHVGAPIVSRAEAEGAEAGPRGEKSRGAGALRAPPRRCLRSAAVRLRGGPDHPSRAGRAGQLRGRHAGVEGRAGG
jgi:hypothetical protein